MNTQPYTACGDPRIGLTAHIGPSQLFMSSKSEPKTDKELHEFFSIPPESSFYASAQVPATSAMEYVFSSPPVIAEKRVGDLSSNKKGSGARFNNGKPDMSLIPAYFINPVDDVLYSIGRFQMRQEDESALYRALEDTDPNGNLWTDCANVFAYGKKKYAAWNWAKGMPWSVPIACAIRHRLAMLSGEENDVESGLPHSGHIACNLVMLLWYCEHYKEGDDRIPEFSET